MKFYSKVLTHVLLGSFVLTNTYLPAVKAMSTSETITPSVEAIMNLYKLFPGKEDIINQNLKKLTSLYENYINNKKELANTKSFNKLAFILCLPTIIVLIKYLYCKADFYKEAIKNWYVKRKKINELLSSRDSIRALGVERNLGSDVSKLVVAYMEQPRDVAERYQALSYLNRLSSGLNSNQLKNKFVSLHQGSPLNSRLLEFERMMACIGSACAVGFPIIYGLSLWGEKNNYKNFNELYNQTVNACLK